MKRDTGRTISVLLRNLDEAYRARSWHGTNLRGSIRGLTAAQAAWRPGPQRHNIREIVVHAAYWKYVVRRRLTGEKRGSFPLKGSNWFARNDGTDAASWKRDVALLDAMHASLVATVRGVHESVLPRRPGGSRFTHVQTILGIAAHDLYHAGQIQLIKRLMR